MPSTSVRGLVVVFTMLAAAVDATATQSKQITVTVKPASVTLNAGTTKQFSAAVANATNKAVTWSVNGILGGDATVGRIDAAGLYTAPPVIPPSISTVTVEATSVQAITVKGASTVTLVNPAPVIYSLSPSSVNVGAFSITVNGKGFIPASQAYYGTALLPTTYVSARQLTATGSVATPTYPEHEHITVVSPVPGGGTSNTGDIYVLPPVSVTVRPSTASIRTGATQQFSAQVQNNSNRKVKWYAGGVLGGSASYGTISVTGLYTAPVTSPPSSVEVKAVSEAAPAASGTATVTLLNPVPIITGITPASLTIGTGPITVAGSGFLTGATIQVGGTATAATFVSANELRATVDVKASVGGVTTVIVTNPNPGSASSAPFVAPVAPATQLMTAREAARFLEMATWGPTPDSIAHLQEVGTEQFLAEQFSATSSTYPEPVQGASGPNHAQQAFFDNAFLGQDQLRQRVAFALSQILVVSGVKTGSGYQLVPYMRLLHEGAFGNYFTLLKNVTLNPTMGRFLDMVNNAKADPRQGIEPNENHARELLQLFTVGLVMLNQNGTPQQDGSGNAMPAYTEETVKELAKALTGWTYAPQAGKTPRPFNQPNYAVPMTPWEANHDTSAKTLLLNELVPAGQTARQDLDSVIANIARHPNVAPFVALRLIQRLVMGNPSPAYVGRVATAFSLNGGDLASVTRAILLDPEAMSPAAEQGKLSEPILFITRLLRGLNATVATGNNLHRQAEILGQKLWFAPSVFNYFSPSYRIRGTNVVSPEFQITTPSAALNRANFVYKVARGSAGSAVQIDMSVFERLARDPRQLVEVLSAALLEGGMSQAMKDSIITAVSPTNDMRTRARNAVYLVGVSSQFQVER